MRALIFDTETTDLVKVSMTPLNRQPRMIEFFGLVMEDGVEKETCSFLCDPEMQISAEITRITGIAPAMLVGQPTFAKIADKISALIMSCDEVVAHNLKFDKSIIDMEFARLSEKITLAWPRLTCTVEATEYIKGFRLSLMALHEHLFEEAFKGAHRAETDVRALTRCFSRLRENGDI